MCSAPAGLAPTPFVHGMASYGSEEEFVETFLPFCRAGQELGEPVVVRVEPRKTDLLCDALGDTDGIELVDHCDQYVDPPSALAGALELVSGRSGGAAGRMRLIGELPPMNGLSRDAWLRYEAAATHALREHPVLAVCPFDRRWMPEDLEQELLRLHHVVLTPDGRPERNAAFQAPEVFLADARTPVRDPLELTSPQLELTDPTPAATRHALMRIARDAQLPDASLGDLMVAASEVVTNALLHGGEPVHVRAWACTGRVVVAVRDSGDGPDNPFAGLLPRRSGIQQEGGRGLWITHQLCPEVALSRTADGFTVRLAIGNA